MNFIKNTLNFFKSLRSKYFRGTHYVRPAYRDQTAEQKEAALAKAQAKRDRKALKRKSDARQSWFYNYGDYPKDSL